MQHQHQPNLNRNCEQLCNTKSVTLENKLALIKQELEAAFVKLKYSK